MKYWLTDRIELDRNKKEIARFRFKEFTMGANGDVLDETEYHENGDVACKRIYRYFEDGTVKEYVEYDPLDELVERHVYVPNADGEIERIEYEYGNTHKVIKEFRFSDLGLADTATLYDESGSVIGFETYIFNENGDIIEQIEADPDNMETVKFLKTYDETGNPVKESKYIDGKLAEMVSYTYDSQGNVSRKIVANVGEGYEVVDEYKYDEKGNLVYNSSFQNGTMIFENRCIYDEDQNLVSEEFFEISYWEKTIKRHEKLVHFPKT